VKLGHVTYTNQKINNYEKIKLILIPMRNIEGSIGNYEEIKI